MHTMSWPETNFDNAPPPFIDCSLHCRHKVQFRVSVLFMVEWVRFSNSTCSLARRIVDSKLMLWSHSHQELQKTNPERNDFVQIWKTESLAYSHFFWRGHGVRSMAVPSTKFHHINKPTQGCFCLDQRLSRERGGNPFVSSSSRWPHWCKNKYGLVVSKYVLFFLNFWGWLAC